MKLQSFKSFYLSKKAKHVFDLTVIKYNCKKCVSNIWKINETGVRVRDGVSVEVFTPDRR